MQRQLRAAPEYACHVSFSKFATAVAAGSAAGFVGSLIGRFATRRETHVTQEAMATFAHAAAFWLVGGVTWVMITRRPGSWL